MIESKIGSWEGADQLRRYAGHLEQIPSDRKTLAYITRNYDPKEPEEILSGFDGVSFEQLRWHDFYRFLQTAEKDALTEEIMAFMEEQSMSRSHRFSTSDLMALSGVPRAFEIFDETLGDEVKAESENFAGNKVSRREAHGLSQIRWHGRHIILAPLHGVEDLFCFVGYSSDTAGDYPWVQVNLEAKPRAEGRELSVKAMRKIALIKEREPYSLDNPSDWAGVERAKEVTNFLSEEDHVAAVKQFFIESIRQLREELKEFKKENPDLPWNGGGAG